MGSLIFPPFTCSLVKLCLLARPDLSALFSSYILYGLVLEASESIGGIAAGCEQDTALSAKLPGVTVLISNLLPVVNYESYPGSQTGKSYEILLKLLSQIWIYVRYY